MASQFRNVLVDKGLSRLMWFSWDGLKTIDYIRGMGINLIGFLKRSRVLERIRIENIKLNGNLES